MSTGGGLTATLLAEVLRDSHRYAPGLDQGQPTLTRRSRGRKLLDGGRERGRDLLERAAARAGFSHQHFDAGEAARRLESVLALSSRLEVTYGRLADEPSRRALIDVLKLRVLGPHHSPLRITPQAYRARQAYAERELRRTAATFEVSDPYFSPLSLYAAPVDGTAVSLHSHSVDVVNVFLHEQYRYPGAGGGVRAEPGDVVIDAGGCWGDTALYFAALVGPAGRVYTFEFDPESLAIMRANLALNPELAERVEIVERALWDRSGETLEFAQAGRMTALLGDGGDRHTDQATLTVPTVTLEDFAAERELERLDLVKLDVEGAEPNVLTGGRGALARFAPKLAIAAYHRDDDLVTIPEAIAAIASGYRLYLASFSPLEDETVLFAAPPRATALSSST